MYTNGTAQRPIGPVQYPLGSPAKNAGKGKSYAPDYKDVMLGITPATKRAGWSSNINKNVSTPPGNVIPKIKGQCHAPDYKDVMLGVTPAKPRASLLGKAKKVDTPSSWFSWISEWLPQTALLGLQYGIPGLAAGGLGYYLGKQSHQQVIEDLQNEKTSIENAAADVKLGSQKMAADNEQLRKSLANMSAENERIKKEFQAMNEKINKLTEKKPEVIENKDSEKKPAQTQNAINVSHPVQSSQQPDPCNPEHRCCRLYSRQAQPFFVQPYMIAPPMYVSPLINYWPMAQVSVISQPYFGYMRYGYLGY